MHKSNASAFVASIAMLISFSSAFGQDASPQTEAFRFGAIPYGKSPEEVASLARGAGITMKEGYDKPSFDFGFFSGALRFLKGRFFTDGLGLGITYLHPDAAKEWQSSHSSTSPSITAYFYRDASTGAFRLVALFKTLPDTKGELDTVFSATTEQLTKVIGPQPDIIKTTWNGNTKYHPPARVAHWETAQEILFLGAHAGLFDEKDISRKVGYISRDEWQKYVATLTQRRTRRSENEPKPPPKTSDVRLLVPVVKPTVHNMPFTTTDFHNLVDPDIWVLEQMLTLPTDLEPVVTKGNKQIEIDLVDTVALPHMQDAVRDYRRRLLPAIFVTAQKVFAELFRVVLGAAGHSAGNRPFDVEQALQPLVTAGSISVWHPFTDAAHLSSWWDGQYNFTKLRLARNQVLHNTYSFAGGRLYVRNDAGVGLVDWCENDILEFAGAVAEIGKRT